MKVMCIPTMTAEEACEKLRNLGMRISPETIRLGIMQNQFPFGYCIQSDKSVRCGIYRKKLDEFIIEMGEADCDSA